MKNLITITLSIIVTTLNAQINWNKIEIPTSENLNEIDFVNDSVGFVCGEKGVLFKTVDAGENWQSINTPDTFTINSVAFIDELNGGILYGNNNPLFYVTTDGGISWEAKASGNGGFCFPRVLFALEDKILIGGQGCFNGDEIAIYENDTIVMDTILWFFNEISNFDFVDENIGFASSTSTSGSLGFSRIYKTIDGGLSWDLVTYTDSLLIMNDIAFEDENIGYCVSLDTILHGSESPAVLFKTIDGGITWNDLIGPLFVTPTFTDVEVFGADSILAVGLYENQFFDHGTVWLNFSDTFPQWFSEDFNVDTLSTRLKKNDVLENNGCLYVIGDNGFIAKTCFDSSTVIINAIADAEFKPQFRLFPNPSKGIFSFEFSSILNYNYEIHVYDLIGKERFRQSIPNLNVSDKIQLDLSFLEKGNYYFTIVEKNKKYTYQFTILE